MKTHNKMTASSVIAELCEDDSIVRDVEARMSQTRFVAMLTEARARKGMTQKDVATKIGTSVSKVSRFEASNDDDLRIGDAKDYLNALDLEVSIAFFDKSMPTTSQIKHYIFEIEKLLTHLTSIAKDCDDDRSIVDGISRFRGEVLYNFIIKYVMSGKDFPKLQTANDHSHSKEESAQKNNATNQGATLLMRC